MRIATIAKIPKHACSARLADSVAFTMVVVKMAAS